MIPAAAIPKVGVGYGSHVGFGIGVNRSWISNIVFPWYSQLLSRALLGAVSMLSMLTLGQIVEAWPAAVLLNSMLKLAKPQGGHRLIGLTSGLYRAWSGIRRPHLADWSARNSLVAHWDTAVKGSSCLQVALLRAGLAEAALHAGASAVHILWDIEKFYDSVVRWPL